MKLSQFSQAAKIAADLSIDLSDEDDSILFGCGLPGFKPVYVTLRQVAKFIRWQTLCFNGAIDTNEMQECARIAKKSFLVIGE